jgi:hypothetical protein
MVKTVRRVLSVIASYLIDGTRTALFFSVLGWMDTSIPNFISALVITFY